MRPSRCILLLLAALILTSVISTAAEESPLLKPAVAKIDELSSTIPVWERNAAITRFLAIAIAIMAAIVVFLQAIAATKTPEKPAGPAELGPAKMPAHRWIAAVSGLFSLAVAVTTAVLDKGFPADYRGYGRAVITANDLKTELEMQVAIFRADPNLADRADDTAEIREERHKARLTFLAGSIEPLLKKASEVKSQLAALLPLGGLGVVYAAEMQSAGSIWTESTAACNALWQAQELSYAAAVEKMALRLRRWANQPDAPLEPLRDYVRKYAEKSQSRAVAEKETGMQTFSTKLVLSPLFLNWNAARPFFRSQAVPTPAAAVAQARGTATVQTGAGGSQAVDVRVRAPNPRAGDFLFTLSVEPQRDGAPRLMLQSFDIYEDGSALVTPWRFVISIDGRQAIELPTLGFDDSAKPTRCRLGPEDSLVGTLPPSSGTYKIEVTGYKQ